MIGRRACHSLLAVTIATAIACTGCAAPERATPTTSVVSALRQRDYRPSRTQHRERSNDSTLLTDNNTPSDGDPPIATVNGSPIQRSRLVKLLLQSHGPDVLERLIRLDAAAQRAEAAGVEINESDVAFEYRLALRRLSNPLGTLTADGTDEPRAELLRRAKPLLETVLAERNVSREEFFLTLRTLAYLRKIALREVVVSEDDLRAEFDRRFGRRARVRHIQLGSSGDVARVQERLARGEDFAGLASRYSANTASAKEGGLLEPFAQNDEEVPQLFRRVAFALKPGEVSHAFRIGEWRHLVKLVSILPAESKDFEQVRPALQRGVRSRLAESRMRELQEKLLPEATIEIRDPLLRDAFEARFGPTIGVQR